MVTRRYIVGSGDCRCIIIRSRGRLCELLYRLFELLAGLLQLFATLLDNSISMRLVGFYNRDIGDFLVKKVYFSRLYPFFSTATRVLHTL